jgi:hypothetical protein
MMENEDLKKLGATGVKAAKIEVTHSTRQMQKKGKLTTFSVLVSCGPVNFIFFPTPGTEKYEIPAKISRRETCHQAVEDAEARVPRRRPVLSTVHPLCAAA